MPALGGIVPQPTNMTRVGEHQRKGNRDDDVRLYILIVVGASVFLLLIPLFSYMVRWSKRKLRRRKRRKQAEKAHARVMAEKEIIQQRMYETQLAKREAKKPPSLQLDGMAATLEVPPRSPVRQEEDQRSPAAPKSPLTQDNGSAGEQKVQSGMGLQGVKALNGLVNRGYQTSSSMLSIPMRKSTSDLYLPKTSLHEDNSKRRFSEDWIGIRHNRGENGILGTGVPQENIEVKLANKKERSGEEMPESDSTLDVAGKSENAQGHSAPQRKESLTSGAVDYCVSESDDYDDISEDIYQNVKGNESDCEGEPIYDNVEGICDSDNDHIYSNVDELSENSSHIYTNVDESILDGNAKDVGDIGSGDDDYENLNFAYRSHRRYANGSEGDESDASSVSYENVWESDEDDLEQSKVEGALQNGQKEMPPLVPRRIPMES